MTNSAITEQVSLLVAKFVRGEFQDHTLEVENDECLGGHLGNIICAKVVGTTSCNQKKEVRIVVKYSSENAIEFLRLAFEREIFIYNKLIPFIRKFQSDKKIGEIFNSVPQCYETSSFNGQSIIILENLRESGYQLYNRKKPMDLHHQKMVLREYAKLHALSFAFRDQKYEEFNKIASNLSNVAKLFFENNSVDKAMVKYMKYARDVVIRRNEIQLVEKLDWILENGPTKIILNNVLNVEVEDSVVTHGDSWNNNIMFRYKVNEAKPTQLAIIDWQLSAMHSPMLDISLFIYTVSSEEELAHFEELIAHYYSIFSNFLRQLGSDPEKLFPFFKLKEHWYKYSIFPTIWITTFLRIILEEEGPKESKEDMFDLPFNEVEYEKRMIAVMKHHENFKFRK